jgi:Tfp pilus assembly protein PilF
MNVLRAAVPVLLLSMSACGSDATPAAPAGPPTEGGLPSETKVGATPAAAANVLPPGYGQLPPPAAPHLLAYLDGLDALMAGRWPDAVAAFSRTLETAGDDPTFVLARGVASTLADQFAPALADLSRARKLGLKGREGELWTYAAEAMSGTVTPEHTLGGGPRTLGASPRPLVSIPGHIVQGRDDYTSAYGTVIAYELGMALQKLRLPPDLGGQGRPDALTGPEAQAAKLKAGQWFAARAMRRADLAPAHFARAKALYANRQFEAALGAIGYARTAYPDNVDLSYLSANSWLEIGRALTARREYTIALTGRTDFAAGYLGRAAAAARVGDRPRVDADLASAATLDAAATSRARPAIEAELARQHVDAPMDRLLAELDAAAAGGADDRQLRDLATRVHKAGADGRLRYDEVYQDTLRALEDAVRADARNPGRFADLARYLVSEADSRGDAVEPRRERVPYRLQLSRERELNRAIQIADLGLAIDPRHAGALIQRAMALSALRRYDQAEAAADQALQSAGNNAEALRLYARFRAMRANQMSAEAASLRSEDCSSSTTDHDRGSYIERVTTTTCYPPSQAELARAAQLEAAAADLRRRARAAMEKAVAVSRGTVAGFLIEADLRLWDGNTAAAQAALQSAVKLDPKSLEAQDALADLYAKTGQLDAAEDQLAIARALVHTTAAPMLRQAWRRADKTAWQGAAGFLARARQLDPGDARVPAYLAVTLEGQGKTAEATAAYRTAVALEDALVGLDEPTGRAGPPLTREPLDFGVALRARIRHAEMLERANQVGPAADLYLANAALTPRISRGDYSRQMFTSMLPGDQGQGGAVVPAPVNVATWLAQSSLAAARALRAAGRTQEADRQLLAAASFGPAPGTRIPRVGNARGDTNFSDQATAGSGEAMLELARQAMNAGRYDEAMKYLQGATSAGIPDRLRPEVNQMNMAIARLTSSERQPSRFANEDPERRRIREVQEQRGAERERAAAQVMAARARVFPGLVGTWTLVPDNQFLPLRQTLTIDAAANYTRTFARDGQTSRGRITAQTGRDPVRGGEEPSRGQLILIPDSGEMRTLYYEFKAPNLMEITDLDGTKYTARKP